MARGTIACLLVGYRRESVVAYLRDVNMCHFNWLCEEREGFLQRALHASSMQISPPEMEVCCCSTLSIACNACCSWFYSL